MHTRRASLVLLLLGFAALVALPLASGKGLRMMPPKPPRPDVEVPLERFLADAGEPLLVANYPPEEARRMSRVTLPEVAAINPFTYSGFLTVDAKCGSNMFYWFLEAQNGNKNAPIVIWLQGGPGASSLFGLFGEIGPFSVSGDLQLVPRNITWNANYSLLFFDNPVAVGFSYTNLSNPSCLSTNETQVAQNLYTALQLFYTVYPEQQSNDLYVSGESYAGKYIPALAYYIDQQNRANIANKYNTIPEANLFINLKGIAVGDGLTDPYTQVTAYGDLAYYSGLADYNQRAQYYANQTLIQQQINASAWADCSDTFGWLVNGPPDYFTATTGVTNYYDIRYANEPDYGGPYDQYVNQSTIRAALHVGNNYYYADGSAGGDALNDDICKSVKQYLPTLIANYKVLFYNGEFDFIVAPITTEIMLQSLQWSGQNGYQQAPRTIWQWSGDNEPSGYVHSVPGLTQIVVRGAGHLLPGDQPGRAFDMITRFIENQPWTN